MLRVMSKHPMTISVERVASRMSPQPDKNAAAMQNPVTSLPAIKSPDLTCSFTERLSRLTSDFSRKSDLGIGRFNIGVPAASGLLAARYVGNRPNPLCWNDPFPFQQGIEAISCEVLERLNFPGRPADLQRLNLLCRP